MHGGWTRWQPAALLSPRQEAESLQIILCPWTLSSSHILSPNTQDALLCSHHLKPQGPFCCICLEFPAQTQIAADRPSYAFSAHSGQVEYGLAQQAHDLYCCVHLIDSLPRGQGPVYSRQHPRLLDLSYLPHPQQRQRLLFSNTRVTLLPVCFPVFAFSFPYLPRDPLVMPGLPEAKQCLSPRPTMAPSLYTETLGGYFQLTSATVRMKYMDGC